MSATPPSLRSLLTRSPALALLLFVAVLLAYGGTFPGHFFLDDGAIVRDNPLVARFDLRAIFLSDYWGEVDSGLYRPLTILSYSLNRLLLGPGASGFHAVNVVLHACNAVLLSMILSALGLSRRTAWFTAFLFALHPVSTESVNVIVGRAELMAASFVFLGLWLAAARPPLHAAGTGLCYLAGLLSKEHAVTFGGLLLLADLFEAGKKEGLKARLGERAPLYALLAAITLGWILVRSRVLDSGQPLFVIDNPVAFAPAAVRILTALKVQVIYLGTLLVPLHLQPLYSGSSVTTVESVLSPWGIAAGAALAGAVLLGFRGWAGGRAYGLGVTLYAVSFSVTANVFFPTAVLMAERFAYLPAAWFCLVLVSLLTGDEARQKGVAAWKHVTVPFLVVLMGASAVLTVSRNRDYQDPTSLWEAAVREDPSNVKAWMALGEAYWEEGRGDKAEKALVSATEADPLFPDSFALLGEYRLRLGKPREAIEAARRGGDGPLANLVLAKGHLLLGRPREALAWLDRVRPVPILRDDYFLTRGDALGETGDLEGAVDAYRQLAGSPLFLAAAPRYGLALLRLDRPSEAEDVLRPAAEERPSAETLNLLGVALARQGRVEEARAFFSRAVELDPSSAEYRKNYEKASGLQR